MNNKTLGLLALVGTPFYCIGVYTEHSWYKNLHETWFTRAWVLKYMIGWMCSIMALQRLEAIGSSRFGKGILWVVISTLTLANIYNLAQLVLPTPLFQHFVWLNAFWPISNLMMLVIGIMVVRVKRLPGWQRYVPLIVGLWFPVAIPAVLIVGRTNGIYDYRSLLCYCLIAVGECGAYY